MSPKNQPEKYKTYKYYDPYRVHLQSKINENNERSIELTHEKSTDSHHYNISKGNLNTSGLANSTDSKVISMTENKYKDQSKQFK